MKIGILFNRITWEIKQIVNELEKKKIGYSLINNQDIFFKLNKKKDIIYDCDLFLERSLSYLRSLYSTAILETKGYKVINNFECLNITGNKLLTTLKLVQDDIPTPQTCIAFTSDSSIKAIEEGINYPAIIKPIIGSWGRLIAKLDDFNSASANLEVRETLGNILQKIFYIQKYLPIHNGGETTPTDLRVFVIGNKCIAAMGRFHQGRDFRSNLAIGGTAKPIELTLEIEKLSQKAANATKGDIVGIDLMKDEDKLSVIEVNGTPQFKGVASATKINIAEEIIDYIINNYK
ncbi:MAG: RimK family alpha-L-glutamate ligase [Candidatus Lokiarchaeota archaeon]|nr:RimK family alpha-L-glutamate ligase [Candidatus Lokiarchaeota archaeon]